MSKRQQVVSLKLYCDCQSAQPNFKQQSNKTQIQELYKQFAKTLEEELRKQHDRNRVLIDDLNNQIFALKNAISKLQLRNKRDIQSEKQLRKQNYSLLQRLKEAEAKVIREVEVIQKVKQVLVQVNSEQLKQEIKQTNQRLHTKNIEMSKIESEKKLVQIQNQNLKDQHQKLSQLIAKLRNQIEEIKGKSYQKDRTIQRLNQQNNYLKNNKQIVSQTKYLFPDFKTTQKIITQTKYQTIYIQKPIEKLVFVDVQKKVKQIIEPSRPLINRIINCEQTKKCRCEQQQQQDTVNYQILNTQISYLKNNIKLLQNNIDHYKSQRQTLVGVIQNKNSQLNHLQTKIRLMGSGLGAANYYNKNHQGQRVNVIVTKAKEQEKQQPVSYKQTVVPSKKPNKRS